jgi:thiol-disulfide isomerase/thioredoxin
MPRRTLTTRTKILLALLVLALVALRHRGAIQARLYGYGAAARAAIGRPAAELPASVEVLDGPPITLAALRGQVVLLHFWAFACANCERTIPSYVDWQRRFADRGLRIVGVHTPELDEERSIPRLRAFVHDHGITWPTLIDEDERIWDLFHVDAWPTAVLLDRAGVVRGVFVGDDRASEIEAAFTDLLAAPT